MTTSISMPVYENRQTRKTTLAQAALIFVGAYVILFLCMSRRPNFYDEGIILTGAMRVAAGQVPHRDFYANYGPAQFYILAGLFKTFGESIFVERLFDLLIKALLVASVYDLIGSYCRRVVAFSVSFVTVLWLVGLNAWAGSAIIPVSLLNVASSSLMVSIFLRRVSGRRMFAAGALAGLAGLFRYDTGVALMAVHAAAVAIAVCTRDTGTSNRLRGFVSSFWPYLLGCVAVVLPPVLLYLSVAPAHEFVYDIFLYPSKYYHRGRNLPFPRLRLKGIDDFGVYLPIAIVVISFYVALTSFLRERKSRRATDDGGWREFLVVFGLLALAMYFKGIVRVTVVHMYLAIIPSVLLIAVLFEHRFSLSRAGRWLVTGLTWLSVMAAVWSTLREAKELYVQHSSIPERILMPSRQSLVQMGWCKMGSPLTRGFCFLPEDDRLQTIEFIESNTGPDQQLFVGVTRHDRIFANDNLIYFATQRLPATKWSHFDPGLQNSYEIQTRMIRELEASAPPYIVRDSEFDAIREPNDSSKSTGVVLLDEYLDRKYRKVAVFGEMSIWQRFHK